MSNNVSNDLTQNKTKYIFLDKKSKTRNRKQKSFKNNINIL
ncbi:hypothetical protein LEP1GSC089_0228 [Leptospira interrogans serovar Autumnalis str. LP101]|uniref:Uncharacterized protein n=1 Tax=Leptospira interrogans serovar Zanoni str. LT2156 TaxID=1001601 RepID=M6HTX4_LEPIR|nr:hypothetical protein LEP1GSC158_5341 [Leptospira interrogans serovar Zanoni str. LT2156]EMN53195.1 hypothetical protein LEP1GSC089_0228 [Leptospira interrogans serovar Autumnalis str. LP101]